MGAGSRLPGLAMKIEQIQQISFCVQTCRDDECVLDSTSRKLLAVPNHRLAYVSYQLNRNVFEESRKGLYRVNHLRRDQNGNRFYPGPYDSFHRSLDDRASENVYAW